MGSDPFAGGDEDVRRRGRSVRAGRGSLIPRADAAAAGIAALREKWHRALPTSVRCTYILTTADTLVPPELQRTMAASVGAHMVEIPTRHGPFREQPQRLAELLVGATR